MGEATQGARPPSATKPPRRPTAPIDAGGVESFRLEGNADRVPDAKDRLEAAKAVLKRLAAGDPEVSEAEVDRIIRDAEEGSRKLPGVNIGAGAAAGVPAGSAQRAGSSCRPPSKASITRWGSPSCRLRRTTATDRPDNG